MILLHLDRLQAFSMNHPDAETPLAAWRQCMENADFDHFPQLKGTFGTADYVRPYTVFNISGNKYRLVSVISYHLKAASVECVLTHQEYDKGKWKK